MVRAVSTFAVNFLLSFTGICRLQQNFISPFEIERLALRAASIIDALFDFLVNNAHESQYKDTYQDELLKYIKKKVKAGDVQESEHLEADIEETDTNVIDLMPFLQKSLKASKTPKKTKSKTKPKAKKAKA